LSILTKYLILLFLALATGTNAMETELMELIEKLRARGYAFRHLSEYP